MLPIGDRKCFQMLESFRLAFFVRCFNALAGHTLVLTGKQFSGSMRGFKSVKFSERVDDLIVQPSCFQSRN